jgi:hypothetical protein
MVTSRREGTSTVISTLVGVIDAVQGEYVCDGTNDVAPDDVPSAYWDRSGFAAPVAAAPLPAHVETTDRRHPPGRLFVDRRIRSRRARGPHALMARKRYTACSRRRGDTAIGSRVSLGEADPLDLTCFPHQPRTARRRRRVRNSRFAVPGFHDARRSKHAA